MTVESRDPVTVAASPDPATADELQCPLCGYDLRGLTDPRCPECGYAFTWEEMRDPARRLHPYLFEHHPERNVSSFLQTLIGGLRPRRFWTQLTPQKLSAPRRLLLYWLGGLVFVLPAYALAYAGVAREYHRSNVTMRAIMTRQYAKPADAAKFLADTKMTLPQYLQRYQPLFPSARFFAVMAFDSLPNFILFSTLFAAFWPWATMLVMRMTLWITLRRARLRVIHLLRCAIHCGDVVVWYWLALAAASAWLFVRSHLVGPTFTPTGMGMSLGHRTAMIAAFALLAALVVALYRLTIALRKYLRLPNAIAVVVLTQILVLLAVLIVTGITSEVIMHPLRRIVNAG